MTGRLAKEQNIETGVETKGWGIDLSKVLERQRDAVKVVTEKEGAIQEVTGNEEKLNNFIPGDCLFLRWG